MVGRSALETAFPIGVTVVAVVSLVVAAVCSVVVVVDVVRRPPRMRVMAVVWPVTMLFGSLVWLLFYWRKGRAPRADDSDRPDLSMRASVAVGASHCGAGCALGDLVGEFAIALIPGLAVIFGYGWLWSDQIFAAWTLDFLCAYVFGIAFQYFAIAPMRDVTVREGLGAAIKADTASIAAWQVGMYGFMALAQFVVLPAVYGHRADPLSPVFWMVMQIAMVAGFITAYPVNWLLIKRGIKERM